MYEVTRPVHVDVFTDREQAALPPCTQPMAVSPVFGHTICRACCKRCQSESSLRCCRFRLSHGFVAVSNPPEQPSLKHALVFAPPPILLEEQTQPWEELDVDDRVIDLFLELIGFQ